MTETRSEQASSEPIEIAVVTRWTRYGKDRAYVKIDDLQLGYRDLQTGEAVCEATGRETTLLRATEELWAAARAARYRPRHAADPARTTEPDRTTGPGRTAGPDRTTRPTPAATPAAAPTSPPALLADRDLRSQQPGHAVKLRAAELRDAAPVRSRVQRLLGAKTEERNWRIGGDAEEAVARRLGTLGPQWRVLHAIPVGDRGSDIDHLVVGPAGVFTINAKNHPDAAVWVGGDTVRVNGFFTPYVRNSRHEAARAARLLTARALFDVEVRGIVAIMGMEKGFTVTGQPHDGAVVVVTRKRVAAHLRALPPVLGAPSIERIFDVARHLATWQPDTVAWSDQL